MSGSAFLSFNPCALFARRSFSEVGSLSKGRPYVLLARRFDVCFFGNNSVGLFMICPCKLSFQFKNYKDGGQLEFVVDAVKASLGRVFKQGCVIM